MKAYLYMKLENNEYPLTIFDLRRQNQNISFPDDPNAESLLKLGYVKILESEKPEFDMNTQYLVSGTPAEKDGEWYETWVIVEKSPEIINQELTIKYTQLIQNRLDSFAKERNYDNILSAATYIDSAVPRFQKEAVTAISLRDETWKIGYEVIDKVASGKMKIPTEAQLLKLLPKLVWE